MRSDLLVTPAWLADRLGQPGIKVVDASWYLQVQNRDANAEFLAGHIPGAVFFDIDRIADQETDLPHMLPEETAFAEAAGDLGLSEEDTIIVYDGAGLFSAPRVWWTFDIFGAKDARILDGGLPAWRAAGLGVETGAVTPEPALFRARLDRARVRDLAQVAGALSGGEATVIDARPAPRFAGEAPEPRPGIPSGHMPGALNLPADRLVENGRLVGRDTLQARLEAAGVDLDRPVVTTCGSGVTAALLLFALRTLGKRDVALYDGSWAEWASRHDSAISGGRR